MTTTATLRVADFGPLVTNVDIDEAILGLLQTWLPTDLSQIERDRSLAPHYLPRPLPRSYVNTLDDNEFPDQALPAIIVTSASTEGPPTKDAEGIYYAIWNVMVSCVVRGQRPMETRKIASLYEGAVRRIMLRCLDTGLDSEIRWSGTHLGAVADPTNAGRYLAAGIGTYLVLCSQVAAEAHGPFDADPYPDPDPDVPDDPWQDPVKLNDVTITVVPKE